MFGGFEPIDEALPRLIFLQNWDLAPSGETRAWGSETVAGTMTSIRKGPSAGDRGPTEPIASYRRPILEESDGR